MDLVTILAGAVLADGASTRPTPLAFLEGVLKVGHAGPKY